MVWRNTGIWVRLSMVAVWWLIAVNGAAAPIDLGPPEKGTFILDGAGMVIEKHEDAIRALCTELLAEQNMPLVVVTIDSMADVGRRRDTIEEFALKLFYQWGRDPNFAFKDSWRRGILLVVSEGDRKARIELGADWAGQYDEPCQRVMDQLMVPEFKEGSYSTGILQGVSGLVAMSRGEELPEYSDGIPDAVWLFLSMVGLVTFIILGLQFQDWLEKKWDPEAYAERMEWLRLEEAKAATKRKRRRKKGRDYDDDHLRSSSYDSGSSSDFGGGGGATGSW